MYNFYFMKKIYIHNMELQGSTAVRYTHLISTPTLQVQLAYVNFNTPHKMPESVFCFHQETPKLLMKTPRVICRRACICLNLQDFQYTPVRRVIVLPLKRYHQLAVHAIYFKSTSFLIKSPFNWINNRLLTTKKFTIVAKRTP